MKKIEYYGNGQIKCEDDEKNYQRGYCHTANPNPFNTTNFNRLNSETFYNRNGIYTKF